MCKEIIIFVLAILVITIDVQAQCKNGALCLSLQYCPGLHNRLKDLNQDTQSIRSLLGRLHCGFDNNISKICCPPQFQGPPHVHGLDLLPNTTVCGIQAIDRVYGGVETHIDEHPWTALIWFRQRRKFNCGGVLISSRYVLTAAHCVKGVNVPQDLRSVQVRLGEWNLASRNDCQEDDCSSDPLNVDVENIISHENYNPDLSHQWNDIALIRLVRDVSFTDFVKPICLPIDPTLRRNTFEAYDMEAAGWGQTETKETSDVKLKVSLRVSSIEDCRSVYAFQNLKITDQQLCAGGVQNRDTCRGDSGGALMGELGATKNWMAIGITSYGVSPCGTTGWPAVYTRVTEYLDWILSTIRP